METIWILTIFVGILMVFVVLGIMGFITKFIMIPILMIGIAFVLYQFWEGK